MKILTQFLRALYFKLLGFILMPVTNVNNNFFAIPFKGATARELFRFHYLATLMLSIRFMVCCAIIPLDATTR